LKFGPQVEPESVATDSFMVNLQSVMLRFAEPFMDAKYSKASLYLLIIDQTLTSEVQIDRIDPLYFAHSSRIDVKEETRIKATSDEASAWVKENESPNGIVKFIFML
jgi:ubiquitin conjugation factor E4 B